MAAVEGQGSQMARIVIPDIKAQKCIVLSFNDTVWAAKQLILDKIFHDLPKDPLNYSLYLPASGDGKLGKFLDDGYLLSHYAMQGHIPRLEMRYKKRDYSLFASLSDKAIAKANSKANQKKLIEYLISGSVKKVEKLLDTGLDPNYVAEDGNTPLGVACGRYGHLQCIMPLLSAGAHIDFRGKDGLTPMHRAAIGGNAPAVNVLLSYRASPNYRDAKGLTPVFHTAIMGDDTAACATLLRHRAELGCTDHGGWTELHHAAKYGHCQHVDLLIRYGADINAQNLVGNTPLHVAASHGQSRCAILLLKRGASRDQSNFAGQTPSQVAILCGHHKVSGEISGFDVSQVDAVMLSPEYNPNARIFAPATFAEKKVSELCPVKPPVTELAKTLNDDWQDKDDAMNQTCPDEPPVAINSKFPIARSDSTSTTGSASLRVQDHPHADSESISSAGSGHSGSGGPNTPLVVQSSFQQQRERLYRAGAGKYVVVQDYDPQTPGDIPLRRGMPVEVMFVGKGGYWEGRAGGLEGWFPCVAIKEVASEQQNLPPPATPEPDYPGATVTQQVPLGNTMQPVQYTQPFPPAPQVPDSEPPPEDDKVGDLPPATAMDSKKLEVRSVTVVRGSKGYGFAMRGVRATKTMQFRPSPQVPALQYIGNVEDGGAAAEAGLCTGDFLLEVNGHNVTYSTHDEVVAIVRKSGGTLRMKVVTPSTKPRSVSQQMQQQMTVSTPESSRKSSTTSNEGSPKPVMKSSILSELKNGGRETVIGGGSSTLPRSRGSPAPPRISRTGWDSSQEDISSISSRKKSDEMMKGHPILKSATSNPPSEYRRPAESYQMSARSKSFTLPPPDYPKAEKSSTLKDISETDNAQNEADKEEEESPFAKALRERKSELSKRSAEKLRIRANTMPDKNSPLLFRKISEPREADNSKSGQAENSEPVPKQEEEPEDTLSPLQLELLKASKRRSERMESKQPRMSKSKSDSPLKEKPSVSNNPLAKAISERINSLVIAKADEEGDDFDSSPGPSPVSSPIPVITSKEVSSSKPPKAKLPPPTVRPKPSKKSKPETSERRSESPVNVPAVNEKRDGSESPFRVRLKSKTDRERSESPVNISGSNEDGRSSPLPFKVNLRSRTETKNKTSEKKDERDEDGAIMNWKSVLKPAGGSGRASPVMHDADNFAKRSPKSGPIDSILTPDSGQAGSESQFTFEAISSDFTLPPPLQANEDNRVSFIDLEPPEAFFVEGVESGADSGVAGDLPMFLSPTVSEGSSIPPPIPSSSPPEIVSDPTPSAFVFPDFGGDVAFPDIDIPAPKPISPMGSVDLPSPLPSPTSRSSSRIEDILHSPIPPPMFGDDSELPDVAPPGEEVRFDLGEKLEDPAPAEGTSESKTSLDSDMSETPPPPPPSEPPPFMDINESVDIIDASIKSLAELDGLLLQEPPKAKPAMTEPAVKSTKEEQKLKQKLEPKTESIRQQPPAMDFTNSSTRSALTREPAVDSTDVPTIPSPKPTVTSSSEPPNEAQAVAKKLPPVQTKPIKSPPPESIESRIAPEGTAKPREGFSTEEIVQSGYKGKAVAEWDIQDVCQWLKDIGLSEHASMFEENEIIGEHLLDFGKDDLKELGVRKLGHQKTFISKLNLLL